MYVQVNRVSLAEQYKNLQPREGPDKKTDRFCLISQVEAFFFGGAKPVEPQTSKPVEPQTSNLHYNEPILSHLMRHISR